MNERTNSPSLRDGTQVDGDRCETHLKVNWIYELFVERYKSLQKASYHAMGENQTHYS